MANPLWSPSSVAFHTPPMHRSIPGGYSTAGSADEFASHLEEVFGAIHRSRVLAGFCYTQLTDTVQEANGLTDERRKPKLPIDTIHGIVTGDSL